MTNTATWSPDSKWIVYDVRSDPAGTLFDGDRIEKVNVDTGEVVVLYRSSHGACCGVATFSPISDEVVFILGPENPTPDWQYAPEHRQGVVVNASHPFKAINLDARDITQPLTPGALRGGSHVHVFSGDGQCVSFTYEDHLLARRDEKYREDRASYSGDRNQRNVGVGLRGIPVRPDASHPRNCDGEYFSVLVTKTVNNPRPGSDEISKAYDDAWVGTNGYVRSDGTRQKRAIAFLGNVVGESGQEIAELFIVDLPDDLTQASSLPLEGTATTRPAPPLGTMQRRLTHTCDRKFPGIAGPRHWPRSSPDGEQIAFLKRDSTGQVQLWTISPNGGEERQVTFLPFEVTSAFSWHPDGSHVAFVADGSVFIAAIDTGKAKRLTAKVENEMHPRSEACIFSPNGRSIAYVKPVEKSGAIHNQVFVVNATIE